uniref:Uncharacterized protein n=1 Tax=Leersia perrieri TaxID=77586 RepID=A0A0D9X2A8_9ORYZ
MQAQQCEHDTDCCCWNLIPCGFQEDYGCRVNEIILGTEHGGVAAEEDDGGPGEGQRTEGVSRTLHQSHHAYETIQPLLRRGGYLLPSPATALRLSRFATVFSAGDVRH